jgi:hypothetical protein
MSIDISDARDYKLSVGRVVRLTDSDLERLMRFFETTVGTIDCATLFTGEVYDWTQLDLVGWCNSRGMLTEDCSGYHVSDYFRDGKYLGSDDFGVCPVFTRDSVAGHCKSIDPVEITTKRQYKTFDDGAVCAQFCVWPDGTVAAWDPIANHYSSCHSLTIRQQQMIRAEARK